MFDDDTSLMIIGALLIADDLIHTTANGRSFLQLVSPTWLLVAPWLIDCWPVVGKLAWYVGWAAG